MKSEKINIIIAGVSYFSSGVSVMRVRNLFAPLRARPNITIKNFIVTSKGRDNQFEDLSDIDNIGYKAASYNLHNILSIFNFIIKCFSAVRLMKERYSNNILYIYHPDLEMVFIILFAKLFNYRVIFDVVEDNSTINDYSSFKSKVKTFFSLFLINRISWFADGAIAISSHIEVTLRERVNNSFPLELIPISVDLRNFPLSKRTINNDIILFYGGSFGEKDSIDLLLDAFETVSRKFDNVKLVMTGKGAKRHMDKLYNYIENNSSKDKIIFKGFLPVKDYYLLVNECDIMCVIRSNSAFANGGFPFKLGEYLASGKAVIVSDVSDIKYYIKDKINALLIKPDSKDDLVLALETLINNPTFRIKIGEEGRRTAEKYFDNKVVTNNFFSFIEEKVLQNNE